MILPIHAILRARVHAVLGELYALEPTALQTIPISYPPNRVLGDLTFTVAFELARTLRKAPTAIAREIVDALGTIAGIARVDVTPHGYINVFLDRPLFLQRIFAGAEATSAAQPAPKVIVEHTAINPNKAAHIGHLRNCAIGDTLVRLLRFLGVPVEVQNYIDDTGVQVADIIVGCHELEHMTLDEIKAAAARPRFDYYCWDLYARVTAWYEADRSRLNCRALTLRDLEQGDNESAEIGRFVADQIVRCHLATMDRLNVEYDLLSWESDLLRLKFWARAFEILKEAKGIYLQTTGTQAGCWVMRLDDAGADTGTPGQLADRSVPKDDSAERTKVIVRSDGTVTYVGKDIAYQFWKFGLLDRDFCYRAHDRHRSGRLLWSTTTTAATGGPPQPAFGHAAAVYNVIDTRQSYLQQLLKKALVAIEHADKAERSVHVSYEMVALSQATAQALRYDTNANAGRPFVEVSGRKGLGVKADDLLDRLTEAARREVIARHAELSANETDRIATTIATAAVRYFMIKYSRGTLIAFDIDEALSFEGESGPYLQYAVVRATNILQKLRERDGTDEEALRKSLTALSSTPLEDPEGTHLWGLVLAAARLDEVANQAVRTLELSVLAKYAFGLAQAFNAFYHRYPVISEERQGARMWRAAAVHYCRLQLTRALDLMGCEVPPKM